MRNLPIGIEFYKKMIGEDYYYVDKTLMIRELLDRQDYVNLFTRPRRFGKTLALDMLKTFFEKEMDNEGKAIDNSVYFEGKKIMAAAEKYTRHMGQYPVIWLSLKSAKQPVLDTAIWMLKKQIAAEYDRHRYVLLSDRLLESDKILYQKIMSLSDDNRFYADAVAFLSKCLEKYHDQKVIILIDEYDVPLENAYFAGFYDEMTAFIRSLMESALKTNDALKFAVITGCLRVSKESIFTGLNNLNTISLMSNRYAEYFGFTEAEVSGLLKYYGLENRAKELKEWYDGYLFGRTEVYNPWSVLNYLNGLIVDKIPYPRPYWANTSSNHIIKELIENADERVKAELEDLMSGETIVKPIYEDITYEDIYRTQDNLWNFLFLTGYLKAVRTSFDGSRAYMTMAIPNKEIRYIYENHLMEWLGRRIRSIDCTEIYRAILEGDAQEFEILLRKQLKGCISYYDEKESFYHGFMTGIVSLIDGYRILSNRETGDGRADIMMLPLEEEKPALILELKYVKDIKKLDAGCDMALQQIEEREYADELVESGCEQIIKYGICFCRKSCRVKGRQSKIG